MKRFAALYTALDGTTSTNEKLEALIAYFSAAEPEDAAWASYFLSGGKPRNASDAVHAVIDQLLASPPAPSGATPASAPAAPKAPQ